MPQTRRYFVRGMTAALGAGLGGAAWWVAASKRRGARLLRTILADARRPILAAPLIPEPLKWPDNRITISWLGHSTVLINFYGINILTDPALGSRVGLSLGLGTAGPKRYIAPALKFEQLPTIDLVLLSHAHMDHMDLRTLGGLKKQTRFVTASRTQDIVAAPAPNISTRWVGASEPL